MSKKNEDLTPAERLEATFDIIRREVTLGLEAGEKGEQAMHEDTARFMRENRGEEGMDALINLQWVSGIVSMMSTRFGIANLERLAELAVEELAAKGQPKADVVNTAPLADFSNDISLQVGALLGAEFPNQLH